MDRGPGWSSRRYIVGGVDVTDYVHAAVDAAPDPSDELLERLRPIFRSAGRRDAGTAPRGEIAA